MVVNASNVVLDLGGHTVDGSGSLGSAGISVTPGKTGVTIRNGIVRQFDMGVYLQFGSSGSLVSGLTVSQNKTGLYGAQLSDNNRIRSNRFTQNSGDGVFLMAPPTSSATTPTTTAGTASRSSPAAA